MKMKNKLIACTLSMALIVTAMPVNASAATKPIKLAKKSVTLKITKKGGKTSYGKAKIKLKAAKGVKIKSTKYKVKNKKIAKVNKSGMVTARKKGKTKIQAIVKYIYKNKAHKQKLTFTVKVKKVSAVTAKSTTQPTVTSGATVAPGNVTVAPSSPVTTPDPSKIAEIHMVRKNYITYVGGSTGINPQVLPETAGDSQDIENPILDYQSKDPEIAVVNEYGLVTGKREGVTTIEIKAKDGSGVTASATVKVVADQKLVEYVDDYYEAANAPIIQEVLKDQEGAEVSWSAVGQLEDTISEREDTIIQNAIEQAEDNIPGSAQDQIAALYQTAADKSARENGGIGALSAYVEKIDAASTVGDLLEIEAELDRKGIAGIFNTSADVSQEDAKTYKLYFNVSDYALSEYSYSREDPEDDSEYGGDLGYDDDMENINSEEVLQTYADSLLEAAGEEEAQRSENIAALKEIFQKFAVSYDDLFDQILNLSEDMTEEEILQFLEEMGINLMVDYSPEDLQKLMENCDLLSYLEAAGYDTTEHIVVVMPSQMKQIDACLTEDNLSALKEYAKYEMLNQYATYLSEEIYNNYSRLYEVENGETFTAYEDFAMTKTKELLEWEISSIYTEQYESAEKKENITDMVDKIVEQYSKEIDACSWMSDATKENAQKKLSAIEKNILYPDDYTPYLLEGDLLLTEEGGSLLDNIIMIDEEYAEAERVVIGDKMTGQDWTYSPLTVNAFYLPTVNGIYICSGIAEKPVYDSEKSDAMNYGGLGMIIAHEISHAFDDTGALYDEKGDAGDWWTEEDANYYADIRKQLINYYNSYYLLESKDMPLFQDGQTTLSENIADLAGVACVIKLVGDDKESKKDFFINFANMWAEVGTLTEDNLLMILLDEHSVAKVRVNAVVSMLDEFYEAFDVQEEDAMYVAPKERIRIWR